MDLKKIQVEISERAGEFYATSKQVPGFLLCAKNITSLDADIYPAMKLLLSIKEKHQKSPAKSARQRRLVECRELAFA